MCACRGIESCFGAYGTQSCVECVVYELIKATFEAKQRDDGGRKRERIPEKQDGMRGTKREC